MKANAVYRIFDADDHALYVGLSQSVTARLNAHARKDWWADAVRVEITLHPTAEEMARTEIAEIDRLKPAHNVMHCPWRERAKRLIADRDAELAEMLLAPTATRQHSATEERKTA